MDLRVDAVIFDLDGVIRTWPGDVVTEIEVEARIPEGSIEAVAFRSGVLADALLGRATRRAWHADVACQLEARFGALGRSAADRWSRLQGSVDPAMLDLVRRIRERRPVALLSNADRALREELDAAGLSRAFDAVVISAEIGIAKPDPRTFLRAARLLGRRPSACLVVDDDPANLRAASAAGFPVHRHRSSSATRRALSGLGA